MGYDPESHHRRSIRLTNWDYGQAALHMITLVTEERVCWFEEVALYDIVEQAWRRLKERFPTVELDAHVIMPNHFHAIMGFSPPYPPGGLFRPPAIGERFKVGTDRPTLGQALRSYKAATTCLIRQRECEEFAWQRNYYQRIIRDVEHLEAARRYILNNAAKWINDPWRRKRHP